MKNTLAENMLRFAPKNLNAIDIKRLLQLVEQEVAAATGGAYKTDPMYKELYSKLGDQAKLYWDGKKKGVTGQVMTDEDRDKLLASFKQKIAEAIPSRGKDQNKVLKNPWLVGSKKSLRCPKVVQSQSLSCPKVQSQSSVCPKLCRVILCTHLKLCRVNL